MLEINVLPHQKEFILSKAGSTGLVAGYGAGKSHAGTLKTIIKKLNYPKVKCAYYLPNHPLIRDIAFEKFPEVLSELKITYKLNKTNKVLSIDGYGDIIFRGMHEPDSIVGYEVGYSLIDECDLLPQAKMDKVFKRILARNRQVVEGGNIVDVVGTPEGYKWFYDRFVTNANENYRLIRAKTIQNKHLPLNYIETLKEDYDPQLLKAYLNGEFVNLKTGGIYHNFNRDEHVVDDFDISLNYPLSIAFDFNISPYNACYLIQEINGCTYVIDNAIIKNKPLNQALLFLKDKFKHLGSYLTNARVYGDAAGGSRQQGTGITNYKLIQEAGFSNTIYKKANPRVIDRTNAVNSRLKNFNNQVKLKICKRNNLLIQDLEQLCYNERGEVDKSNLALSHDTDSLGYYIEYNFGLNKPMITNIRGYK